MVRIEDAMLDFCHIAICINLNLRDAYLRPDKSLTGNGHMTVLPNAIIVTEPSG